MSDTISDELDITPYVKKISLDTSPCTWAETAISLVDGYVRTSEQSERLRQYSIENTVSQLGRIYLEE